MPVQRQTKQLQAVRKAIESAGRPLSIDELHDLATRDIESLGLRTVYRLVRRLQEEGEIVSVAVPGDSDRYELASVASKHHHHFHCTSCDRYFDIHGCPGGLSKLVPEGFKLEHHDLTLSGLCDACA
ncbi:MAG: transcriptional repressor [Phycisphaerales bacterium]|nr:transcriptional repressor [Phycisphaerales bacterium]